MLCVLLQVFRELQEALHNARFDDSRLVMLTGSGAVFCSGIDLHYLQNGDRKARAKEMADAVRYRTMAHLYHRQ